MGIVVPLLLHVFMWDLVLIFSLSLDLTNLLKEANILARKFLYLKAARQLSRKEGGRDMKEQFMAINDTYDIHNDRK